MTVTEGRATDTYAVVLTTQPSSSATVTVDDSAADVSATPTTLTFTASKPPLLSTTRTRASPSKSRKCTVGGPGCRVQPGGAGRRGP